MTSYEDMIAAAYFTAGCRRTCETIRPAIEPLNVAGWWELLA